jgi:hypothetical protein
VVGFDVSAGIPSEGIPVEHEPSGFPFGVEPEVDPALDVDVDVDVVPGLAPLPAVPLPLLVVAAPPAPGVPLLMLVVPVDPALAPVPPCEASFELHAAARRSPAHPAMSLASRAIPRLAWRGMGSSLVVASR